MLRRTTFDEIAVSVITSVLSNFYTDREVQLAELTGRRRRSESWAADCVMILMARIQTSCKGRGSWVLRDATRQGELAHQTGNSVEIDNRMMACGVDVTESAKDRAALIKSQCARRSEKPLDSTAAQLNNVRRVPAHLNTILRRHRWFISCH